MHGYVQVIIDDSTSKIITGTHEYDRDNGGTLIVPSGTSFPGTPEAKELFWRTDENKLYRRNDGNSAWEAAEGTLVAHADTHEDGGSDEISVAGLSGELADPQPPKTHASEHEPGGSDTMAVDAAIGTGSLRTLGTGAQQACAGNDSRLSDARTPTSHTSTHQHGGSDEIATATPAANAIPKADSGGKLAAAWIPATALPQVYVVADETARLALTVQEGDEAIQLDNGNHYIYDGSTWYERPTGAEALKPEAFATNESTGGQVIGDWPSQDIGYDDEYENSDPTVFDWNDPELTILKAGKIQIIGQTGFQQTAGSGRTIMTAMIMHQPFGGAYDYQWGSKGHVYLRNSTDGNYGQIITQAALEVSAGDKIKVVGWRESGGGTVAVEADASSLAVLWFPN